MDPAAQEAIVDYLDVAWAHLGRSSGDMDMPDPIAHADIAANWPSYRSSLVQRIMDGRYTPSHVEIVDLPKDRLTVRPLARLSPEYRLIYDAAIFAAADIIESAIPTAVYSYRWWKKKRRLLGPGGRWLKMQRTARDLHKKKPSLLLARTDITAFYEHVDHDILLGDLAALGIPKWSMEILEKFLHAFNGLSHAWGVPQGSDASGMLANLYLVPLDLEIARHGFRHFRYSDDVYIFGDDWISLREVILKANRLLRYRHLNLSGMKTNIIGSHAVAEEFEDSEKDALSYGVSFDLPWVQSELHDFFDRITGRDPVSTRDLKFALTQLRMMNDSYAIAWLLDNMGEIPHIAREALIYLAAFHDMAPNVGDAVVDLLTNSKLVIYPYAEQHLLIYMIYNGVQSSQSVDAAWMLLLDRNKESFVREFAARYLGLYGPPGGASRLRQEFQSETDARVRRALLVACYESKQCSDRWLDVVAGSDADLELTASYLKTHPDKIPLPVIAGNYGSLS
ncbi:RNA-directed DNA polymerase [Nonomuraea fuscirosea]|uniref:RNA-directed DNA polymerase n=1 Tax=Nonomuraea fuscirosea TaxID=1291556 RepID=UPI00340F061F